jgi:hypothetical protein
MATILDLILLRIRGPARFNGREPIFRKFDGAVFRAGRPKNHHGHKDNQLQRRDAGGKPARLFKKPFFAARIFRCAAAYRRKSRSCSPAGKRLSEGRFKIAHDTTLDARWRCAADKQAKYGKPDWCWIFAVSKFMPGNSIRVTMRGRSRFTSGLWPYARKRGQTTAA